MKSGKHEQKENTTSSYLMNTFRNRNLSKKTVQVVDREIKDFIHEESEDPDKIINFIKEAVLALPDFNSYDDLPISATQLYELAIVYMNNHDDFIFGENLFGPVSFLIAATTMITDCFFVDNSVPCFVLYLVGILLWIVIYPKAKHNRKCILAVNAFCTNCNTTSIFAVTIYYLCKILKCKKLSIITIFIFVVVQIVLTCLKYQRKLTWRTRNGK